MTSPISTPPPLVPGVLADVRVQVISLNQTDTTATIRVVDNNGAYLTGPVALPQGLVRPIAFAVELGDVLEATTASKNTGVVRWLSEDRLMWSESPTGVPARTTAGWQKLGTFTLP